MPACLPASCLLTFLAHTTTDFPRVALSKSFVTLSSPPFRTPHQQPFLRVLPHTAYHSVPGRQIGGHGELLRRTSTEEGNASRTRPRPGAAADTSNLLGRLRLTRLTLVPVTVPSRVRRRRMEAQKICRVWTSTRSYKGRAAFDLRWTYLAISLQVCGHRITPLPICRLLLIYRSVSRAKGLNNPPKKLTTTSALAVVSVGASYQLIVPDPRQALVALHTEAVVLLAEPKVIAPQTD